MSLSKIYTKHLIGLLILILFPFLFVGGVNYVVDPLQIYRQSQAKQPAFWENQRCQNAGKIKSYLKQDAYDSILLGNSVTDCFVPKGIEMSLGWKKNLKLTVNGGQISELSFMLDKALEKGEIKHVLWGLRSVHLICDVEDKWHAKWELPCYLYTDIIFDDGPYLFSNAMFQNSLRILERKKPSRQWLKQKNAISWLNYWMTPNRVKAYAAYESSDTYKSLLDKFQDKKIPKIDYNKHYEFPAMEKHILGAVRNNSDVEFVLFIAPMHYLALKQNGRQLERMLAAQKYLVEKIAELPNANVYGFENLELISGNLANYRDGFHYHSGVNKFMLHKISRGKQRLTPENIDTYLSSIISQVESYTPLFDYNTMIPMRSQKERNIFEAELMNLSLVKNSH